MADEWGDLVYPGSPRPSAPTEATPKSQKTEDRAGPPATSDHSVHPKESSWPNESSHPAANDCQHDLSYMGSDLSKSFLSDPQLVQSLSIPLDVAIAKSGDLNHAIVYTRLMIDGYKKRLPQIEACERESRGDSRLMAQKGNPLDDTSSGSIHGGCAKALRLYQDAIKLNQAALDAFLCRKAAEGAGKID